MLRSGEEPSRRRVPPDAACALALPSVSKQEAALGNRLAWPREALRLTWNNVEIRVDVALADRSACTTPDAFAFVLGDEQGRAAPSTELSRRLAQGIGFSGPLGEEPPGARALLLELMLLDLVRRVEAWSGEAFRVLPDIPEPGPGPASVFLALSLVFPDGGSAGCGLDVSPRLAARLADAREAAASPVAGRLDALAMTLVLAAGTQRLSLAEIAGLRSGDVVMLAETEPRAILGGRLTAPLEARDAGGFVLVRRLAPIGPHSQQDTQPMHAQDADEPEALDAVPIGLVFEIGRLEMPLAELRGLGPGSVLALERAVDEAVDIVANGRRIGRGSLVRIGEGVGVRVVRLAADG